MHYDIIIIGGGLVGAGFAAALRHTNLKIALVDAKLPQSSDSRLFALNHSSCQFLQNIGMWQALLAQATPINEVQVSYQEHFGGIRLHAEDVKPPALGYVIPAYYIESALNNALSKAKNIDFYRPAKLQALVQQDAQVSLSLATADDIKTLQATLVVGADGTESTVRKQLDIPTESVDYQQTAIVTRTQLQRGHNHIAHERFMRRGGAIAMLPLAENECATIWSTDNENAATLLALSATDFKERLQNEFGYRLGRFKTIGERFSYPLRMVKAQKNVVGNVFLMGNSAHTLHPIAAQGFNLAIYEVAALVEVILEKIAKQTQINSLHLAEVSAKLMQQQSASMAISHRLSQIFSTQSILFGSVISLSMIGFNIMPGLKQRFLRRVLGKTGQVPRFLLSNHEKLLDNL